MQSKPVELPSFDLVSSGIDYATFTVKTGSRAIQAFDRARAILDQEEASGDKAKRWAAFGYVGWAGSHIGVGRRLDGAIVRLSGALANAYWRVFHAVSDNCTRLDCAVTAHTADTGYSVAGAARRDFVRWRHDHDRRVKSAYIDGRPEGETFYLGSRASEKYGRIYDKYAEQPGAYTDGTWRWELELKGDIALAAAV